MNADFISWLELDASIGVMTRLPSSASNNPLTLFLPPLRG
jgi:hypothetical protein